MEKIIKSDNNIYQNGKKRNIIFLSLLLGLLILSNILFLVLTASAVRSALLVKNEFAVLGQDKKIVSASEELENQYGKEIEAISQVFPNEETLPDLLSTLENLIKLYSDSGTLKFNSLVPVKEQDRLYLLMAIVLKTDLERLYTLFIELEELPYLTHIVSVNGKMPGVFDSVGEISILLKIYVQNPFSNR